MDQNPEIQKIFHQIVQGGSEINLFNIYQGVPISFPAKLLEISTSSILITTDQLQIVCLYRERETFLQSPTVPEIIKAKVIDIDVANLEAVLAGFQIVKSRIGERAQMRVWPKKPILGQIQTNDLPEPLMGELADISRGGLAFYIDQKHYNSHILSEGALITTTLHLPGSYEVIEESEDSTTTPPESTLSRFDRSQIRRYQSPHSPEPKTIKKMVRFPESQVHGIITYATAQKRYNRYRIGIQINPNDTSRAIITQFISQRQSEIIREIREITKILFPTDNV